jgi:alcohol dehydrogenase
MYGAGDLGGRQWGGAYSDLVRVPHADHLLVPVPSTVSAAQAATLSDNLADAWRTVAPALAAEPGADVLVIGGKASSIGIWAAELAVILGAGRVTYLDTDARRCALAEEAGAEATLGPPPRRVAPRPITIDASGELSGLSCAIRSTESNHTCTSVAIYWEDPPLPFLHMYARGVALATGRVDSRTVLPEVLRLVADERIDPLRIATVVDWDDISAWVSSPTKAIALRDRKVAWGGGAT